MKVTNNSKANLETSELTIKHAGYIIELSILEDVEAVTVHKMIKDGVDYAVSDAKYDMEDELENYHYIINEDLSVVLEKE